MHCGLNEMLCRYVTISIQYLNIWSFTEDYFRCPSVEDIRHFLLDFDSDGEHNLSEDVAFKMPQTTERSYKEVWGRSQNVKEFRGAVMKASGFCCCCCCCCCYRSDLDGGRRQT